MNNRKKSLTGEQMRKIARLAKEMPVKEVAKELGMSASTIYKVCVRYGIEVKKFKDPVFVPEKPKVKIKRPPATYSNTGFLSVSQKYAS